MFNAKPLIFTLPLLALLAASCVPSYQETTPTIPSPTATEASSISLPTFVPGATQTPTPEPPALSELKEYALGLINKDRADHGLGPVQLGTNSAAQAHAQDMVDNFYIAHWDSGGMKPYMRYTQAGGQGSVSENAAYSGPTDPNDRRNFVKLDPKETMRKLEYSMMYEDEASDWGHRDNIIDPAHQYVNIGIAFTSTRLGFIQHFEETFLTFNTMPALTNGTLTISARPDAGVSKISSIDVYFDSTPLPLTNKELMAKPHFYKVGEQDVALIHTIPPAPRGFKYSNLGPEDVIAENWSTINGTFSMSADVSKLLRGPGVYTLLIWAEGIKTNLTTYSIFVE